VKEGDILQWENNPNVYMLRHVTDTPATRQALMKEGLEIVEEDEAYFLLRDANTAFFSKGFYELITRLLKLSPNRFSSFALPFILAQMPARLEYTVTDKIFRAISLPHWRANHSVNAVGAVENIRVLDCEWCLPMKFNDPKGLMNTLQVFSHFRDSIQASAAKGEFPVTVVAEIRFFRGSKALLAPEYDSKCEFPEKDPQDPRSDPEGSFGGWSAPECVTGVCNPWWVEFYHKMNTDIYGMFEGKDVTVRNHLAKQFGEIKNQFAVLRNEFNRDNHSFDIFKNITEQLDPHGVFLPPFMRQFIRELENSEYNPPKNDGYLLREDGTFQKQ